MSRTTLPVLALSLSLLVIGCGDENGGREAGVFEAGGCGPGLCNGCCQLSQCLPGNDNSACGAVGLPCVVCQPTEVCAQGQCVAASGKCNPQSCAGGCCQGDTCQPGTAKDACGTKGQPCTVCATSQKCESQSCGCSPADCQGCCEGGVCRSGLISDACGSGGVPCQKCGSGSACVMGSCVSSSCNANNCTGCCSGATCKAGTDVYDCGQGGETCKACKSGESCNQAVCVNTSQCSPGSCSGCCNGTQCLSGLSATSCGTGGNPCQSCTNNKLCQAGKCTLDPSSSWGIVIEKADIDTSKSWDTLVYTEPDPYVKVSVGAQSGTTTVISNTYTPQWDEYLFSAKASDILQYGMAVEVYDDDWPTSDQLIGACNITVPESVLISGAGVVNGCGSSGDVTKLNFQFTN